MGITTQLASSSTSLVCCPARPIQHPRWREWKGQLKLKKNSDSSCPSKQRKGGFLTEG